MKRQELISSRITKKPVYVYDRRPIEDIFAGMTLVEMTYVPGADKKVIAEAIAEAVVDNIERSPVGEDGRLSRETILAVKKHIENDRAARVRILMNFKKWFE